MFSDALSTVWEIHPFNDGNTRTISKFMVDYAKHKGMKFYDGFKQNNNKAYRNSLVLSCEGDEKELLQIFERSINTQNLLKIIQWKLLI